MTRKNNFTEQEWQTLQFGVLWTFTAVAGVDRDIDKKEVKALTREVKGASRLEKGFVRDVLGAVGEQWDEVFQLYTADPRRPQDGLMEVAAILEAKATEEEVRDLKDALLNLGRRVAEASGGFLGLGSKVSAEEKGALKMISDSLSVETD